jgi:hypothetical protein
MTGTVDADWAEIERLVRDGLTYAEIARRTGVDGRVVRARAVAQGWRAPAPSQRKPDARDVRRELIGRFYAAINTKLKQMERRLEEDIESGGGAQTATDHEREVRTIGGLIAHLGTLSEFEADLARPDRRPGGADAAERNAQADRYRSELARRLARLVPPQ